MVRKGVLILRLLYNWVWPTRDNCRSLDHKFMTVPYSLILSMLKSSNMSSAGRTLTIPNANQPSQPLPVPRMRSVALTDAFAWKSSDQPAWLTEEFYSEKVQPVLVAMSASVIARRISVSRWYAGGSVFQVFKPAHFIGFPHFRTFSD
jgi:hypothetical protein